MNALATKLVTALRSGEYQQIQGRLHDGDGYCCLGVACVVAGLEPEQDWSGEWCFAEHKERLPDEVADALGWTPFGALKQGVGFGGKATYDTLAGMNDNGASFEDIAAQIETGNVRKAR